MRPTVAALLMLLAGCAAPPVAEIIIVDSSYSKVRAGIQVLTAGDLQAKPHREIEQLLARSCQKLSSDAEASEENAIAQLQIKAARVDADAVGAIQCEPEKGKEMLVNCWTSILCRGTAVKLLP